MQGPEELALLPGFQRSNRLLVGASGAAQGPGLASRSPEIPTEHERWYLGLRPHGSNRRVTLSSRGYAQSNWRCCSWTDTPTPCRRWHHTSRLGERPCAPDR